MPSRDRSRSLCWRSPSCQMSSVLGLLFSSRVGLDGEEGPEEAGPEEAGPNSTRRLDLPRGGGGGRGYGALHLEKIS